MEISPIYLQTKSYQSQPSFGTIATGLNKSAVHPDRRMNLSYFGRGKYNRNRAALHTLSLIRINEELKRGKPVELLFCGCSDGTEVADTLFAFVKVGVPLEKLNISAFDISKDMIDIAKKGRINISERELEWLYNIYGKDLNCFIGSKGKLIDVPGNDIEFIKKKLQTDYLHSYQIAPEILKHVNFYQSDLLTELGIRTNDTERLMSCQHLAQYLDNAEEQRKAAEEFYRIATPKSLLFIGDRDVHYDEITDKEILSKILPPNATEEQRKLLWRQGLLTTPNPMAARIQSLQLFEENKYISEHQCVYEKLIPSDFNLNMFKH